MAKRNRRRRASGQARHHGRTTVPGPDPVAPGGQTQPAGSADAPDPFHEARWLVERVVCDTCSDDDMRTLVARLGRLPERANQPVGCVIVEAMLVAHLQALWQHGWLPGDVARFTARQLGTAERAVAVDAISASVEALAADALHPVFAEQLAELGADRWWPPGSSWLSERARRHATPREHTLLLAARLLRLLARVGPMPAIVPPPGAPVAGRRASPADQRVLAKIRALLAKAESTEFAEESAAFTAKAQALMTRHAIDQALLHRTQDEPEGRRIPIDDPYAGQKADLLHVIAHANGCRAVWMSDLGCSTVIGFDDQLSFVDLLYTSLLVQATASMLAAGTSPPRRTAGFRRAFLASYASRIGDRLEATGRHAEAEAADQHGASLLPVLAKRRSAVDDKVAELFPHLRTVRRQRFDALGWHAGRDAADRADLVHRQDVVEPSAAAALGG